MWKELKSEADIQQLMLAFGSFHDSCLKELSIQNREFVDERLAMHFDNKIFVKMLFQRQMRNPSVIEIVFEDVTEFNFIHFPRNYDVGLSTILQAVCIWEKETLYWAEDIDWSKDSEERNNYRWIAASSGRWRIIENGLGPDFQSVSTN